MFKKLKKLSKPVKELNKRTIPAMRFNEMVDYYTHELKTRLAEIKRLRDEAAMVIGMSVKHGGEKQELMEKVKRLQNENNILKRRIERQ